MHYVDNSNLRSSGVRIIKHLVNENTDWSKFYALLVCRLIALNKNPRVRPVRAGKP